MPPRLKRRAIPRYDRHRHGRRYRRRRPGFAHYYLGWWYALPWWSLAIDPYPYPYYDHDYGYDDRCDYWRDRCADRWGWRNPDFYGCMRYHRCW